MVYVKTVPLSILDKINQFKNNMDNKMHSCCIFIDLKKAFDTIDYSTLLQKLDHYGVCRVTNDDFASYLLGRQQTTQIGIVNISKKEVILSGVPQGLLFGPLLFLVYINDVSNSSDQLKFYLFADDTNLLYADKTSGHWRLQLTQNSVGSKTGQFLTS